MKVEYPEGGQALVWFDFADLVGATGWMIAIPSGWPGAYGASTGARAVALIMPENLRAQFHMGFDKFHDELIQTDKGLGTK